MPRHTLVLGAVAYDAKVVTIWDGFRVFFNAHGLPFDYVLFTNYERQVEAHIAGQIDAAWNSPLAWLETVRLAARRGRLATAVAMRDTDRDLTSVVLVRQDSPFHSVADLKGARVAAGAWDSPQAALIPLLHLHERGLRAEDLNVRFHNIRVGQHGDHVGGERDAVKSLLAGEADAACLIDTNTLTFARDGTLPPGSTRVLTQTTMYDHCNFTVLDGVDGMLLERFTTLLSGMKYEDPEVRGLMDLEGLKAWLPGRTEGYAQLDRAVDHFDTLGPWLAEQG
mgnify:CR=1 FL=1